MIPCMGMYAPMGEVGSTLFFFFKEQCGLQFTVDFFFLFEAREELPEVNKCGVTVVDKCRVFLKELFSYVLPTP